MSPVVLAIVSIFASTECFAESADIGATIIYTGDCIKFDGNNKNTNYCESSVTNLRYADGYDSFQFRTMPKNNNESDRDNTSFVGSQWGRSSLLGNTDLFMTLKQVILSNIAHKYQEIKTTYNGQCVLSFSRNNTRKTADVIKIWCEYTDGRGGHALGLENITNIEYHQLMDFETYDR